jgi:hypothetical protein
MRIGLALDRPAEQAALQAMASETVYIVQAYVQGRGKALEAEQQVGCKDAEEARRKAERLAPLRLGVVAFSVSADTEMGDYDENPTIIFKSGQLPEMFD